MVTERSASRSCVMDTLFVVFPLELIADVGDVVIDEVANRFCDGVPAGNADGVTTKQIGNVCPSTNPGGRRLQVKAAPACPPPPEHPPNPPFTVAPAGN